MNTKDLMIGDWVNTPKGNYQIDSIQDNDVVGTTYNNGESVESLFDIDKVKFIPITPEILEANGWMYVDADKVFYGKELRGELPWISYAAHGDNMVFILKGFCYLEYVHQLQHALRLCGIDKDITL